MLEVVLSLCVAATACRIEALQRNFKHLYLLMPASLHGVGRTVGIATRWVSNLSAHQYCLNSA